MNLSRGWLSTGEPRCLVIARRAGLPAACIAFFALGLAPCFAEREGARSGQAAEADVLPGADQPATPDLLLDADGTAKAGALAAFSKAIFAEDNGESDAALEDYQQALSLDPGYTELAVKVAYELARRGDPPAGIQVLKDSIKASPKAPLAYLFLSQLYAKYLGKPELGLKYAQQALDLDPTNFASYVAVYEIFQSIHEPGKAREVLDRAAKLTSTDPQYWLQLGGFYLKSLGDGPIAPDDLKKISAVYRQALASGGDDPVTLASVAEFYARTQQEKEAIPLYLKALKFSPANPPDGDQTVTAIRDSLARCFDAAGRSADAIATLEQLIKDNPLRTESYELLFDQYVKTDKFDAALAISQQLMLLDPGEYRNYLRNAEMLLRQGKIDPAIRTLNDARMKFPTEGEIICVLGIALTETKRYQEALGIFEQAVQEAGQGQTEMLDSQFYFAYGTAAEQCGQLDKAAGLLRKSIDLDPKSAAEAYNYLGFMWVDRGLKLEEAGGLIKKALEIKPDEPAYIDSLGWYYFKKGEFKRAVETLRKAASLIQPEDAIVDEHLGDAYAASGDTASALDYWQKAAAIDKENKEITVKIAGARQKLARQGAPAGATP